jgi:toxin ParE1/3/4
LIVPPVRFSTQAEDDIDQIASYTVSAWGTAQANRYLNKLEDRISALVTSPLIGRPCDSLQRVLRRLEIERHVVFYLPKPDGVLIVRVLHCTMLPNKHL